MKILRTVKVADVDMTASDWGLFYDDPGAEEAAHHLSLHFEKAVNTDGSSFESVRNSMEQVLQKYHSMWDGDDPILVLGTLLKKIYCLVS